MPFDLNENQTFIFEQIRNMFEKADLLGELDGYVIAECAITIDRLQQIEKQINENPDLLFDRDALSTRKEYVSNFLRFCNELSLSPQARAKVGSLSLAKDKEKSDPLLKILSGDNA